MTANRLILLIAAAVSVWGVYHAVGAYLYNHNPWRGVVVLGCVAAYLGFWSLMLSARRARLKDQRNER